MDVAMRVDYPGLLIERHRNGTPRYRVRVEGDPSKRVHIPVGPDHPDFTAHYRTARKGGPEAMPARPIDATVRHSVAWLTYAYLEHLEDMVGKGQASQATLNQRRHFMQRLREFKTTHGDEFADMAMAVPQEELIAFRDAYAETSGSADNMIAAIRSMYRWAVDRRMVKANPAVGVPRIHRGQGGATAWTVAMLHKFIEKHPKGTRPYLALTLFMFTAARVSDAIRLGRGHEFTRNGATWLDWTPQKKNAKRVRIPMAPQLHAATRAETVIGQAYLLTQYGKPFKSTDSFRNQFKKWCVEAGLPDLSPHGIRKAAGLFLAERGATQYGIMAIHGHADPKTSAIYTEAVARDSLAEGTAQIFGELDW